MSDAQDDTEGDGGRTDAGGDPGAQAQGGQPQGQPAGQQAYRQGPGVGDIFSIPETVNEMKIGVALNVLLAVGLAIAGLGLSMQQTSGFGAATGLAMLSTGAVVLAPLVGVVLGLRQAEILDDQPGNVLYANALVTSVVGTFLLMLVSLVLISIIVGSGNLGNAIGQMLVPYVVTAIGAGVVAAGSVWVEQNVLPGPSQPAPQQGQGQPR